MAEVQRLSFNASTKTATDKSDTATALATWNFMGWRSQVKTSCSAWR
jgi:hypothetical protein